MGQTLDSGYRHVSRPCERINAAGEPKRNDFGVNLLVNVHQQHNRKDRSNGFEE